MSGTSDVLYAARLSKPQENQRQAPDMARGRRYVVPAHESSPPLESRRQRELFG